MSRAELDDLYLRREILDRAVALIAPPSCVVCRAGCLPGEWICGTCRGDLHRLGPGARTDRRAAAFPYEGVARDLIAALKFSGAVAVADEMASLMIGRLPGWITDEAWVVPVPAHPSRRRVRGYNQSALLARRLAARTGATYLDCLVRTGTSPPQSELSRARRLAMPAGSVRFNPRAFRHQRGNSLALFPTNVLLCDDVSTTGVTLEICTSAICEGHPETGPRQIRAVTFASTPTHGTTDRIARRQSRRPPG